MLHESIYWRRKEVKEDAVDWCWMLDKQIWRQVTQLIFSHIALFATTITYFTSFHAHCPNVTSNMLDPPMGRIEIRRLNSSEVCMQRTMKGPGAEMPQNRFASECVFPHWTFYLWCRVHPSHITGIDTAPPRPVLKACIIHGLAPPWQSNRLHGDHTTPFNLSA